MTDLPVFPDITSFWDWFLEHEPQILTITQEQPDFVNDLNQALKRIHPDLACEVGTGLDGKRELVLSAGGIRDAFPWVNRTVDSAPALDRWRIVRFKPRLPDLSEWFVVLNGKRMSPTDIRFVGEMSRGKINITGFLPGYRKTPDDIYEQIFFILLDATLGEYDVVMRIGEISLRPLPAQEHPKLRPLPELRDLVDSLFAA